MRGKFIAIEGCDAGGKHTQSLLLAEKLCAKLISFPRYETEIGKLIRSNLQNGWATSSDLSADFDLNVNSIVRQALFTLDRYDASPDIIDALASGKNVVADRYWVSGLIYGTSDLVDAGMLERVHQCLPQPDVWVLLDVPVEESFRRRPERQDVYERDREKLAGIRKRYLELFDQRRTRLHKMKCLEGGVQQKAQGEPLRCTCDVRKWVIVDGVGEITQVHNRIVEVIR